jgi:hypothetical protein
MGGEPLAWENRDGVAYDYRALRRDRRTLKEYIGRSPAAELASRLDARARREREQTAAALKAEISRCEAAEQAVTTFESLCDLLMSASLHAVGYHRHRSGPWRRRRHGWVSGVE